MFEFWKSMSYATKFSGVAFIIAAVLGLFSMGFLGLALYYPVSFLFNSYPTINDWHGDWVWPAFILAGMGWSFGFVLGGIVWHFLSKKIRLKVVLQIIYIIILWLWAALIWYLIIKANVELL